jgi:hypothetical protein
MNGTESVRAAQRHAGPRLSEELGGVSGRDARYSLVVLCCSGFLVFAAGGVPPSVGFLVPPSLSAVLGWVLPLSLKSVAYQPNP